MMIFDQLLVVLATHHTFFCTTSAPLYWRYSIACTQLKAMDESFLVSWAALHKTLPCIGVQGMTNSSVSSIIVFNEEVVF
jgi:hypothetical protein